MVSILCAVILGSILIEPAKFSPFIDIGDSRDNSIRLICFFLVIAMIHSMYCILYLEYRTKNCFLKLYHFSLSLVYIPLSAFLSYQLKISFYDVLLTFVSPDKL